MTEVALHATESPFQPPPDGYAELIDTWYCWARAHREHLGHSNASPMFRGAPSGYTQDDGTARDERDARISRQQAEQVDACMHGLPWQMRVAVDLWAANRHARAAVFSTPRLSPEELLDYRQQARDILVPLFVARGLMQPEGLAHV